MKTLFIGQTCIELTSVDSTNSYASELLRESKPAEGTLICSFSQQNGRGQRGNTWHSEPNKNGAFSYILHPAFLQAGEQFMLTKMCSLAVADLMTEILEKHSKTAEIKIKWPNDIYVGNKKIAGILIENTLAGNSIKSTVMGIGININQKSFPEIIHATSLRQFSEHDFELHQIKERLCEFIEARYLQLKAGKMEMLDRDYLARLFQLNQLKDYSAKNKPFKGKIIGVSAAGKLRMQLLTEELMEFDLKEIHFCIPT